MRRAWFARLLDSARCLTLLGAFRPLEELALSTLRTVLAEERLDPAAAEEVVAGLSSLDPYPDAASALALLAGADATTVVLTNGGKQQTQELLERGGLAAHVETVFSTADVRAYKPDPRPYRHVARALGVDEPGRLALVAAHGWDVLGARACGWEAVWVERLELVWPFPGPPPDRRAADLAGAAAAVARQA